MDILFTEEEANRIKDAYISVCYSCKYATGMSVPWLVEGYVGCRAKWVVDDFDEQQIMSSDSVKSYANTISRPFNWQSNSFHQCICVQGCVFCPFFKQY